VAEAAGFVPRRQPDTINAGHEQGLDLLATPSLPPFLPSFSPFRCLRNSCNDEKGETHCGAPHERKGASFFFPLARIRRFQVHDPARGPPIADMADIPAQQAEAIAFFPPFLFSLCLFFSRVGYGDDSCSGSSDRTSEGRVAGAANSGGVFPLPFLSPLPSPLGLPSRVDFGTWDKRTPNVTEIACAKKEFLSPSPPFLVLIPLPEIYGERHLRRIMTLYSPLLHETLFFFFPPLSLPPRFGPLVTTPILYGLA